MNTKQLPYVYTPLSPMTYVALQLMTNPPKMTPTSPVWAWTVAQLTR